MKFAYLYYENPTFGSYFATQGNLLCSCCSLATDWQISQVMIYFCEQVSTIHRTTYLYHKVTVSFACRVDEEAGRGDAAHGRAAVSDDS